MRDLVVILIVGYRNPDDICTCIYALQQSSFASFIVAICENGGRESYVTLIRRLSDFTASGSDIELERIAFQWTGTLREGGQKIIVADPRANLGYAGGVNYCIRGVIADSPWTALWILNPDTQPEPNALFELVHRAKEGGYAMVGSRLVRRDTGRVQSYGGRWRPLVARGFNIGGNSHVNATPDVDAIEREIDYVSGASMFVKREYVEKIGLMDERYFLYCEEVDWCLSGASERIGYCHNAIVHHAHGTTIGSAPGRRNKSALAVYLDERNKLLLTRKFFPNLYPIVVGITLVLTFLYLYDGAISNFRAALAGWGAGVLGRVGPPKMNTNSSKALE